MAEIKTEKIRVGSGDLTSSTYSTISSGTAAPSGGNDGDIYFRVSNSSSDIYFKRGGSWLSISTNFATSTLNNLIAPTAINASLLFGFDGGADIGASGASRPNNVYVKNSINLNSLTASSLLQTDGSKNLASLANGTNGQIMTIASGVPSWQNPPATAVPTGSVITYAGTSAPTGWLLCNGNTVPNGVGTVQGVTADFSALYAVVGSTYGAAGKLPNCQGVFVRGNGTQTIGAKTYTGTLGTYQNDTTAINGISMASDGDHFHQILWNTSLGGPARNGQVVTNVANTQYVNSGIPDNTNIIANAGIHTHTLTGDSETRAANLALNYIIKY
jgi:microcystin-dependent protein